MLEYPPYYAGPHSRRRGARKHDRITGYRSRAEAFAGSGAPHAPRAVSAQRAGPGAFKLRGAYNKISSLSPEDRRRGVVAHSSGNHAQAVAYAALALGVKATI